MQRRTRHSSSDVASSVLNGGEKSFLARDPYRPGCTLANNVLHVLDCCAARAHSWLLLRTSASRSSSAKPLPARGRSACSTAGGYPVPGAGLARSSVKLHEGVQKTCRCGAQGRGLGEDLAVLG